MAKRRAAARALVDSEVVRVADEAVVGKAKRMRELCPLCQRDLALIGGVHHCRPVLARAVPGSGRSFVTSAVTELPRRIDIERISGRRASKLCRVKVNGRVVIPKTRAPFAIFGLFSSRVGPARWSCGAARSASASATSKARPAGSSPRTIG